MLLELERTGDLPRSLLRLREGELDLEHFGALEAFDLFELLDFLEPSDDLELELPLELPLRLPLLVRMLAGLLSPKSLGLPKLPASFLLCVNVRQVLAKVFTPRSMMLESLFQIRQRPR